MAQLPPIRQNQAGNAHIDGATPSYLPTSINQPNQHMPHRWRNSLTSPDIHKPTYSQNMPHRWRNSLTS